MISDGAQGGGKTPTFWRMSGALSKPWCSCSIVMLGSPSLTLPSPPLLSSCRAAPHQAHPSSYCRYCIIRPWNPVGQSPGSVTVSQSVPPAGWPADCCPWLTTVSGCRGFVTELSWIRNRIRITSIYHDAMVSNQRAQLRAPIPRFVDPGRLCHDAPGQVSLSLLATW